MKCFNCQKVIVPKNLSKGKPTLLPKTCPWCTRIIAPRQSLRPQKPVRK